jgi:heme A synthase
MQVGRFARFAWAVLAWNVGVILWGAYVRASGSGAGCGSLWPMCNGEVVPRAPSTQTLVEWTHRATSGVALALVLALAVLGHALHRSDPRPAVSDRHRSVRRAGWLSLAFILSEALVGAGLVLFDLVAHNASAKRALSMAVHLNNTMTLLACLVATAWFASGGHPLAVRAHAKVAWIVGAGALSLLLLSTTGAVAALGDTLFPSRSLAEGLREDLSPTAHFLVRLRALHPLLAVITGLVVVVLGAAIRALRGESRAVQNLSRALTALFFLQLALGLVNLSLRAPAWMQLVHLLSADAVWIVFVLLGLAALGEAREPWSYRSVEEDGGASSARPARSQSASGW